MSAAGPARRVVVWRSDILAGSETFVRNQFEALREWSGVLIGTRRKTSNLSRDTDLVVGLSRSRAAAWLRENAGWAPEITRAIRAQHPDLVHAHFVTDGWVVLNAAKRLRLPLVVTAHGFDVTSYPGGSGPRSRFNRWRMRRVFAYATTIIAVSDFVRQRLLALGAPDAKIVVHHIGIPVRELPERASGTSSDRSSDVVFIGRFAAKKGVLDLVTALSKLPRALGVRAVLVGGGDAGDLRPAAMELAERLGVDAEFPGHLPPAEVHEVLLGAKVFAAPSITAPNGDAEGFGMVFLEAAAAGVPVASYAHGGIVESVVHGETGLLAPEGDIDALAANIEELLTDPELRARMAERGRARVESDFDVIRQTAVLERIYDAAISGATRR